MSKCFGLQHKFVWCYSSLKIEKARLNTKLVPSKSAFLFMLDQSSDYLLSKGAPTAISHLWFCCPCGGFIPSAVGASSAAPALLFTV